MEGWVVVVVVCCYVPKMLERACCFRCRSVLVRSVESVRRVQAFKRRRRPSWATCEVKVGKGKKRKIKACQKKVENTSTRIKSF